MADAPKLLGTDTLRTAYPKVNMAIDNANEALRNSEEALNIVNQARVDANGNVYPTLQARLNTEQNAFDVLSNSVYSYLSRVLTQSTTVETNGMLKIGIVENLSDTEIDQVYVNGTLICELLPEERIINGTKYLGYDKFNFKDLNFDRAIIAAPFNSETDTTARAQIPFNVTGYRTDVNEYNIISTSTKFRSEKQTNFASATYNYIGLHSGGLIEIKVLKTDVTAAGYSWDAAGIRAYLKTLPDFVFFVRKSNFVTSPDKTSLLIEAGNVTITKKSTTNVKLNFYTNVKGKNDLEIYSSKKYEASVENTIDVPYVNRQVKIYASFKPGECKNENCIVVTDEAGNVLPHQWEDDRFVNYKYDKNMGRYYDGSLKDGYIWIMDSFAPNESKKYYVYVYQSEVSDLTPVLQTTETDSYVSFDGNGLRVIFNKSSKYLLDIVTIDGNSIPYAQDPSYKTSLTTTVYLRSDPTVTVKGYDIKGSGVIFKDFVLTLTNNDFFDFVLETRVFINGIVQTKQYFVATRDIVSTELYGIHQRINIGTGNETFTGVTSKILRGSWTNGTTTRSAHVIFSHGDVPREDNSDPTYPVMGAILYNHPSAGTNKIVTGWEYSSSSTLFDIPNKEVFASCIEANLRGFADSVDNETNRVFNTLVGRITDSTKVRLKSEILNLIVENIYHVNTDYDATHAGQPFTAYYPSFMGRLALWKMYGIGDINQISTDYKTLIQDQFGNNDVETMWSMYQSGALPMQWASRVFPTSEYLLREFTELGNQNEITYHTNLLKNYAEMVCRSVEELGYVGLYYGNGYNSNATAAGMRALSQGIKLEPSNTRWVDAYNTLVTKFQEFIPCKNFVTDGPNQLLSTNHYIHYAMYALFEYVKSTENLNATPIINYGSYAFVGTSAYGAVKEQEYCISSSRRGVGHTNAYIAYLLIKKDTTSSLAQAKRILERLTEQNKPSGGQEFPLELWKYMPKQQTYDGMAPFEVQVLAETMYFLLDQKIRTNF